MCREMSIEILKGPSKFVKVGLKAILRLKENFKYVCV